MKFKDDEAKGLWDKGLKNNKDAYGARIYSYAKDWAEEMEAEMEAGRKLEDIASKCASDADYDGITGFMYGAAVSVLAAAWLHGEQLRRWHNLGTQIGSEGEAANERGTVLNPALLSFGGSK